MTNKTAIQNLARITKVDVKVSGKEKLPKRLQTGVERKRSFISDPNGLKVIDELVSLVGSKKDACRVLGMSNSGLNEYQRGDVPIKKTYADLARYIIADIKAKNQPKVKLVAKIHTAVITLGNEHRDDFKAAVESVGGQYSVLEYPEMVK